MSESIDKDNRASSRRRIFKAGTIAFDCGAGIDCIVRNISEAGACLEIESPVGIPNTFTLLIKNEGISKNARVKWRKAKRIGVAFE